MTDNRISNICPSFFGDYRDFHDFLIHYGPEKGRFIYDSHPHWINEVKAHAEIFLSPKDKKRIIAGIQKVVQSGYIIPAVDKEVRAADNWDSRTKILIERGMKSEFVIGSALAPEPYESWSDVYYELQKRQLDKFMYKGSLHELFNLIQPYVLTANSLWFLDPYFDLTLQKSEELLKRLLSISRNSKSKSIYVVVKQIEIYGDRQKFEDVCKYMGEFFSSNPLRNIKFHFYVLTNNFLKDNSAEIEFHDRFFFTNKKALINLGKGFTLKESKKPSFSVTIHSSETYEHVKKNLVDKINKHLILQKGKTDESIWAYSI